MKKGRFYEVFKRFVASAALVSTCVAGPVSAAVPNDPFFDRQWYLSSIGLPEAWEFAKGSPTVRVAVLDSGVDLTHPDLKDRIWTNRGEVAGNGIDDDRNGYVDDVRGWDFVDRDADPNPVISEASPREGIHHGTLVSGIIGAAGGNGEGMAGVNWNVEIMPLRVLTSDGAGGTSDVEAAVRYAIAQKARVINISFIGSGYSPVLAETLRRAYRAGIVIVAAAGNEGDTERGGNLNVHPEYPVCYRGANGEAIVIGVSALGRQGKRSSFSNYGSDCVGISAPGEGIFTTQVHRPDVAGFDQPYGSGWSGSSLAAPIVSGVAALMISLDPALAPADVLALIADNAEDIDAINGGYGGQLGAGRIDAAATIAALQTRILAAPTVEPPKSSGSLVKSPSSSAVYYKAIDGKRYVFPDAKTYATWYPDFSGVRTVTPAELAAMPLGRNVTYRPGTRLIKVRTLPEVYAVGSGGILHHVVSEAAATAVFGPGWATLVNDLPDEFFTNYRIGTPIASESDYDPGTERGFVPTIDVALGLASAASLSKP